MSKSRPLSGRSCRSFGALCHSRSDGSKRLSQSIVNSDRLTSSEPWSDPSGRRNGCGAGDSVGLLGQRWTLPIVRELVLGPKRFTDFRTGLPAISANVLTQRLRSLESEGIVRRRTWRPPAAARLYGLTA